MFFEEFKEFRKEVSRCVSEMGVDLACSPCLNGESTSEMCYCDPVKSSGQCCLAVNQLGVWRRCNRKRSNKILTVNLERIAVAKGLNLGVSDEDPHNGICLFHWRLIKYGRSDMLMDEDVKFKESGTSQFESIKQDEKRSEVVTIDNSTSSDQENSDDDMYSAREKIATLILNNPAFNWQDVEIEKLRTFLANDSDEEEQNDSEGDEESSFLSALSAASLRRYRKFFMIPTKASASKHAMLEGVENHFERLPVESNDAIIHFIYTAKNRINTIE
ncbi:hypothetical protein DICVIV_06453 [Dictyocaulus viviparus]|uniref:Histone deacetylase complex subunit SAP30 Sin3 binding domain-containing protein n=1 Tax=Dictyocaulus viviparus TaxID=29172 RepID=A0A0D8XYN0_DICVI|nr:hypothetical protein DICVIV_06453 [Dictyocaulus viviparus]